MFRTLMLSFALMTALVFCAGPVRASKPLVGVQGLVVEGIKRIPWDEVGALLDTLGPKPIPKPEVKARIKETIPQIQLRVYTAKLDVTVKGRSPGYIGSILMELSMPADVEYYVDLRTMGPEHLKWDARHKKLHVKLPPVIIGNVTPRLNEESIETEYTGVRYYWLNRAAESDLERKLRRENYSGAAREEANQRIEDARRAGRDEVKKLLKRLLLPTDSEIDIIVE